MSTTIHIQAIVGPNGTIEIAAPELIPGSRVNIAIESAEEALGGGERAIDIIESMPGHLEFQTAEEVDAYLREERDSWDR